LTDLLSSILGVEVEIVPKFLNIPSTYLGDHRFIDYFIVLLISQKRVVLTRFDTHYVRRGYDEYLLKLLGILIKNLFIVIPILLIGTVAT
jgi:hypothetical protein